MHQNAFQHMIPLENVLRDFTGDLTPLQKTELTSTFIDENTLSITFLHHPEIALTVRRQDIFDSHAQVIVNAANTHLGGGGGIDGAIHRQGGADYAHAHHQLQRLYHAHYVEGHAAMLPSGSLKEKYHIENVIVVAGPQGAATPGKETALYSCYFNALVLADRQGKQSIAFPSISTGLFGFSKDRAAAISLKALYDFIEAHPNTCLKTLSIHYLPSDPITGLELYQAHTL